MGKIVAIGGGEIGRPGHPAETTEIDIEIVRLSGENSPNLLFLPTASGDSEEYLKVVENHFGKTLGCNVQPLYLIKEKLDFDQIKNKILASDIIYVGGGNTLKMMMVWRKLGVNKILLEAYEKGIVLSGLSAGSICWFKYGDSDSRKFTNPNKPNGDPMRVKGLGIINAYHSPHYNVEKIIKSELKELMKKTPGVAIAIDNCCAIEVIDNKYRIISSKDSANAYKVYWSKGQFFEEVIERNAEFKDFGELLKK